MCEREKDSVSVKKNHRECLNTLISAYDGNRQALGKRRGSSFTTKVEAIRDKCRTEQASLSHLFWSCTKLTSFSKTIVCFFSEVLQTPIEPSPITAISGSARIWH